MRPTAVFMAHTSDMIDYRMTPFTMPLTSLACVVGAVLDMCLRIDYSLAIPKHEFAKDRKGDTFSIVLTKWVVN